MRKVLEMICTGSAVGSAMVALCHVWELIPLDETAISINANLPPYGLWMAIRAGVFCLMSIMFATLANALYEPEPQPATPPKLPEPVLICNEMMDGMRKDVRSNIPVYRSEDGRIWPRPLET